MEYGLFDIAKAYILYRAERAKAREVEKQETVAMVEKAKLHYIDEKGKEKILDKKKLQQLFAAACKGFEESVSINDLVHNSEGNLYDGMSLEDLGKALVMASRAFIEKDPAYSRVSARLTLDNLYQEVFGVRGEAANFEKEYRNSFVTTVNKCVTDGRLVTEMLDFDLEDLAAYLKPERDGLFEYLGIQVLYDRYFIREEGGERKLETPQTFWMRVAMGMALNEGENKSRYAKEFYDILSTLRYVASTPTLFHSGTTYAQLSSCYLNTVEDDLRSIFKVYGDNAQLSKYSGGIGTDWTNIRGTGALIKATNVGSQGVVPFLKIANDVTVAINRSGKRRGATCAYLETWHYDIEDFLDLRRNTGDDRRRAHDMNTANWIPDLFMKRVIEDGQWTLFSPDETPDLHHIYGKAFDKKYIAYEKKAAKGEMKVFKIMRAKDLWRKMISMLFETGHPWVTFKDPSNVRSPQDHVGVVHNSNLCTEITLNNSETETAVCNLGSVNLSRHMKNGKLDTALVKETVTLAMRMLDNVIDLNFYPTVETKHSNMQHRPVGLGIMGFQDALYLADIDFDSDKAVKFADESMELISYHAIMGSALLAKEKGAYATFKGSKWDRGIFPIDTLDLLEQERGMPIGVSRTIKLDWKPVREAVKKYGMRNSNTMATAPTATISNISGCFPCIEPIYKNLYVKSNMSGEFTVVNEYLVEDLKKLGLWNETMLDQLKNSDGSVQEITSIPPRLRNKYKTVFEVGANWLIKIAAYRGKWIDQSQSLNIFFNGTSGKALSDVYMHAWHLGLKTTYYLRTMAATSIEKSSLDINKNFGTDTPAPIPAPIMHTVGIAAAPETIGAAPKACLISDPDCEACQ
jgi:ribonucleoside-diphosphate reductase alpha chain